MALPPDGLEIDLCSLGGRTSWQTRHARATRETAGDHQLSFGEKPFLASIEQHDRQPLSARLLAHHGTGRRCCGIRFRSRMDLSGRAFLCTAASAKTVEETAAYSSQAARGRTGTR